MHIPSEKLDFEQIARRLKDAGAFDDYDSMMSTKDVKTIDKQLEGIKRPGDIAYSNGPMWLERYEVNLPQKLIDDQRKSVRDALGIYMPPDTIGAWMHEYFSDNFLRSASFTHVLREVSLPNTGLYKSGWSTALDEKLSFNLESPERSVHDRNLYTVSEIDKTLEIAQAHPELVAAVLGYQSAYVGYLMKLQGTLEYSDTGLSQEERDKALAVVKKLTTNWKSSNFAHEWLPAIALKYYNRHNGDISAPLTQEDFYEGIKFASKNGAFRNEVRAGDGNDRSFSCPAQTLLNRVSASDLEHDATQEPPNVGENAGRAVFQIFKQVCSHVEKEDPATLDAMKDINEKIAHAHERSQSR